MKRLLAVILCMAIIFTGCAPQTEKPTETEGSTEATIVETAATIPTKPEIQPYVPEVSYRDLGDADLLRYMEDEVYTGLVTTLENENYFVENVTAVYISKEYLEELAYNSQKNIYFGYTLSELEAQFVGQKFVFTLGDDGTTIVQPFEEYDDTFDQVLKNVAIGSGVILLCVTVSAVAGTIGPSGAAVSMIFAVSAKTGTIAALSAGGFGAFTAGLVTGFETGDFEEAMKAAALAGSEGFKWGAIGGSISGGATEAIALKGATLNGLTMNQAALIQRQSGYPLDVIKQFQSMEQFEICQQAGLTPHMVNGQTALIRNIDLNYVDEFGRTNLERMKAGLSAIDPATEKSYQLHHIGQRTDSTLAILTEAEHMQGGNNTIWHDTSITSTVHGPGNNWDAQRKAFWETMAKVLGGV